MGKTKVLELSLMYTIWLISQTIYNQHKIAGDKGLGQEKK